METMSNKLKTTLLETANATITQNVNHTRWTTTPAHPRPDHKIAVIAG